MCKEKKAGQGLELVTDVGGGAIFTAGDETMHDFDGDENYKDLTCQKQKTAAKPRF